MVLFGLAFFFFLVIFKFAEINNPAFTFEVNPIKIIKMRSCQENK